MKILVLNASPKGKHSTTVQTALYLQALHPEHTFTFLPVGQRIRGCEKNFAPVRPPWRRPSSFSSATPSTPSSPLTSSIVSLN